MYFLTIYMNAKDRLIFRINRTPIKYKIGQQTSMGWVVVDYQYYISELKQFVGEKTMREFYRKKQEEFQKRYKKINKKRVIFEAIYQIFR